MMPSQLYRLAAFTTSPGGGNPAGVWLGDSFPEAQKMQQLAREIGFSETAFLVADEGMRYRVRYFSPEAEVPFCGHATIASGVQLGNLFGPGDYQFETRAGLIDVAVSERDQSMRAALVSVATQHTAIAPEQLKQFLDCFGWKTGDLDAGIPPAVAYAGAWHLVLELGARSTLSAMSYDFDRLKSLMLNADITTIQVIWREREALFHSRNPFPVGGVVEDPATGAAAAALTGYLRDARLVDAPFRFQIRQGEDMGRPGTLDVSVPAEGGIRVSGPAVLIP